MAEWTQTTPSRQLNGCGNSFASVAFEHFDLTRSFHQGGDLALFCDGHAESSLSERIRQKQLPPNGDWPTFTFDSNLAKRWNNDNQPHSEIWPDQ
jgi:hypothetical protein